MSIEDYKLEKQIGSGSFGEVFRGTEVKTGIKVAIKRIRKKVLYENGKYLLKAYYREIEIMKKCACENSIKLIKDFQTQNNFNIIMELCDTDLLCYLYERPNTFSVNEIRDTFAQLNNAFRKMTQNKILHRDLKLGNILFTFTDETKTHFTPKLSDYGFSKELNNYNYATCTHLGTPATMAPEIMMNRPYDEKSDLWSVGVMMYQLYYKEVPFEGNSENEILQKITSKKPFKQPEDQNLRDIINKLLVVNPQERISWDEYFNHPFFASSKFYHNFNKINSNTENESNNVDNNAYLCNAMKELNLCKSSYDDNTYSDNSLNELNLDKSSSYNYSTTHLSLDKEPINIKETNRFGYSYSNNIYKKEEEYISEGGDIYGRKEPNSSKNLLGIKDYFNKEKNLESQIIMVYRGIKINDSEYQNIISSCIEFHNNCFCLNSKDLLENIENKLKGKWFVLICEDHDFNYDFYFYTKNENLIIFNYKKTQFQISRLK